MTVVHIVQFRFKDGTSAEAVSQACAHMLSLKETCLHAQSNKPYITALTGGKDNSPEGLQNGIQYAFVVHFATTEDRDYYVKTDPVHQEFIKANGPLIEKAIVVDYTMGEF
ncbi:hypothetical protein PG985_016224 [Apiospora marii]|uniref:Stress-response A/B barrel domain-containing protein n=1 Tax=Apiospora marii TaxID=335849 RepID=A0ABR1STU5_9PEZI